MIIFLESQGRFFLSYEPHKCTKSGAVFYIFRTQMSAVSKICCIFAIEVTLEIYMDLKLQKPIAYETEQQIIQMAMADGLAHAAAFGR